MQVAEGTKGGETLQWGDNEYETYLKIDPEAQDRTIDFIERQSKAGKPFYVAHYPNLGSFLPTLPKCSSGPQPPPGRSRVQCRSRS